MRKAYRSKTTFVADVGGATFICKRGAVVHEGDPILERYGDMFEPIYLWEMRGAAA